MGFFQRLADWVGQVSPLRCAVIGISFVLAGTYVKGLPPVDAGVWAAVQRISVSSLLLAAVLSGLFLLVLAMVSTQIASGTERLAVIGFVMFGVMLFHALSQLATLGRERYLEAMVPVLAGIVTAWGVAAFLSGYRRRSDLADRFAPRPRR